MSEYMRFRWRKLVCAVCGAHLGRVFDCVETDAHCEECYLAIRRDEAETMDAKCAPGEEWE